MSDVPRRRSPGPSTRAVHAGVPPAVQGTPFLPGPALAGPFHFAGEPDGTPYYSRYGNPSWEAYEAALGELEGPRATAVLFASGMAATSAVLLPILRSGDVFVAPSDGYPGVRALGSYLEGHGVEVRLLPTDDAAIAAALDGATLVWLETPSNPGLDVCDIAAIAEAAHAVGALVAVDNTLATPLLQRPLELGADFSMASNTKSLTGHSDLLLGHVASRDRVLIDRVRAWRLDSGSVPSPFDAWLAHRSLQTLALRVQRQCANALALATMLAQRTDVTVVRYPGLLVDPAHAAAERQMDGYGPVIGFDVGGADRARDFLAACELVIEATSFGGMHTTAERRGRWGTDDVTEGFVRLGAGCEDAADLCADIAQALDATT